MRPISRGECRRHCFTPFRNRIKLCLAVRYYESGFVYEMARQRCISSIIGVCSSILGGAAARIARPAAVARHYQLTQSSTSFEEMEPNKGVKAIMCAWHNGACKAEISSKNGGIFEKYSSKPRKWYLVTCEAEKAWKKYSICMRRGMTVEKKSSDPKKTVLPSH